MGDSRFAVVCKGCGAEARNLNLVGLFSTPDMCPDCRLTHCPLCYKRAHDYRCGVQ